MVGILASSDWNIPDRLIRLDTVCDWNYTSRQSRLRILSSYSMFQVKYKVNHIHKDLFVMSYPGNL